MSISSQPESQMKPMSISSQIDSDEMGPSSSEYSGSSRSSEPEMDDASFERFIMRMLYCDFFLKKLIFERWHEVVMESDLE